jgi:hypothetical protein
VLQLHSFDSGYSLDVLRKEILSVCVCVERVSITKNTFVSLRFGKFSYVSFRFVPFRYISFRVSFGILQVPYILVLSFSKWPIYLYKSSPGVSDFLTNKAIVWNYGTIALFVRKSLAPGYDL